MSLIKEKRTVNKIIAIQGSYRDNGITTMMLKYAVEKAKAQDNEVTYIKLHENKIGEAIFNDIKDRLEKAGLIMHGGTIVDATIISAPSSTKNRTGERDPEMHQTKKGNQW